MPLTDEELQRLLEGDSEEEGTTEQEGFVRGQDRPGTDTGVEVVETLGRALQSAALPAYNTVYDMVQGALGGAGGIDVERAVPTGRDAEGNTEFEIQKGPETVFGFDEETGQLNARRLSTSGLGVLPSRNYYQLQPDGSYKETTGLNAPIPFIGRPEKIDTGSKGLNAVADFAGMMVELAAYVRMGPKNQPPASVMRLAASANKPNLLSKAGVEKFGAVLKKGYVEYGQQSLVQGLVHAQGDTEHQTTASALAKSIASVAGVKPEKLEAYFDPITVNPGDPLLKKQALTLADELLMNMPLGSALEAGFYGANVLKRGGAELLGKSKPFAVEATENAREQIAAALRMIRAQKISEAPKPPKATVDPEVKRISAAERHINRARFLEQRREELGIQRPEQAIQQNLEDAEAVPPVEVDPQALKAEAAQDMKQTLQVAEGILAKQEVASTPGLANQETAIPELQQPAYEQISQVSRQNLFAAPQALQYKEAGRVTKSGASGSLIDQQAYNPYNAKAMLVWRDANGEIDAANPGRLYVVDGHNRLDLANRTKYDAPLNVIEINAGSLQEARVIGAISNISDNKGTGIDAAKLLRDADMSQEELLSRGANTQLARLGIGLRAVPQDIFDKVATGKVSEEIGAAIGSGGLPAQVQRDILGVAIKKRWGLDRVREAVAMGGEASVSTEIDTGVLPGLGLEELTSSNFQTLMDVRIKSRALIKVKIRALGSVTDAKKANVLTDAGNVLNVEQSMEAKEAAIRGERLFNQMAGMSGPLNDLLKEMAGQVKPGTSAEAVVRANKGRLEEVLDDYMNTKAVPAKAAQYEEAFAKADEEIAEEAAAQSNVGQELRQQQRSAERRRFITDAINKAYATLKPEDREKLIERVLAEQEAHGAIVTNPTPIGEKTIEQLPDADLPDAPPPEVIEYGAPTLPAALSKASPNYGKVRLVFESDVDRAIYIASSKKPSKRRTDFQEWLDGLGIPSYQVRATSIQIKEQLKDALFNNPRAPKQYTVADTGAWREGGQLSGELSLADPGGRIGERLSTELMVQQADREDLIMQIREIAGPDFAIEFDAELPIVMDPRQARSYGVPVGTKMSAAGLYSTHVEDPAKDLILLAEGYGGTRSWSMRRQTAFHEAFHRLQRRALTKAELDILNDAEPELRAFAARYASELKVSSLRSKIISGALSSHEVQAIVFQAMADDPKLITKKVTWAKPLQKLLDIAVRVNNWLKGRGYKTWNDVYQMAGEGEMAAREPRVEPLQATPYESAQLAVPDFDPEEAAKEFSAQRKAGDNRIASGDIDIDESVVNETRRLISRSGKTRYYRKDQEQLASGYYALRRVLNENMADVTGIPEFKDTEVAMRAMEGIARQDGPQEAVEALERILKAASPETGNHVVSLVSVQALMDRAINAARLHSVEYESTVDPLRKSEALRGLVFSYDEVLQYSRQYRRAMRVAGQMLRQGKNKPADAALEMQLPPRSGLQLNGSAERIESVLTEGFTEKTVTPGLMGDGIYMTSDVSTNISWGDTQAVGALTSDIKIMDLYSSNKRIQELLEELELGSPKIKGGGIELSPEQIAGVREYAVGKGFDGIRYHGDYKPGENPYDEVVIFNKEVGDRIIDADVAVDPEAQAAGEAIGQGAGTIMRDEFQPLVELLDEDLLRKIQEGVDDGDTQDAANLLSSMARQEPATQAEFGELIEKGGKGSVDRDYLFEAYRGAILFSGQTWWRMGAGTAYRALTAPIAEAAGHSAIGLAQKLAGKDRQAYLSARRAVMAPMKLQQYVANVPNAFRMALTAAKENQTFGRPGYRGGQDFDEAVQQAFKVREEGGGSLLEAQTDFSNPASGNWISHLGHAFGVLYGQGGRVSSGIDTFFNYIVAPTENLFRHLDEQLVVAETQHGLTGDAAWDWAWTESVAKAKNNYVDVHLANGTVVKDGAITGSAVDEVLNFVQFSDKLRMERTDIGARTYQRGVAVARENEITEPEAIHEYALKYMDQTPEFYRSAARLLNVPSRTLNDLYRNKGLKWLNPIMVTPINIAKSAVRGLGGGVIVDTWWRDMLSENPATRARAIGEMAVGWGTYVAIQQMYDAGIIEYSGANPMSYERGRNNEILRTPGFSIRLNLPVIGSTPWINIQPLDGLATALSVAGRVRQSMDYMTEDQIEEMSSGAVILMASAVQAVTVDTWTRDVFGGINELVTFVDKLQGKEGDDGYDVLERGNDALGFLLSRKLSGFVPAFIRNITTDATGVRYQADRSGYVPGGGFELIGDQLDRMMGQFEAQRPGNDEPIAKDPITGFPLAKANTQAEFFGLLEDQPWLRAIIAQVSPGAAFKKVRSADYMPVHTELALLQRHTPKPLVFLTRSNLSATVNGRKLNLGNFESRGLRLNYTDAGEVLDRVTSVKINGLTVEQALYRLVTSPGYQNLSPRRTGIRGEEKDSQRLVEVYKIYKEYREAGVRLWLDETPRGAEFLDAHYQRQRDEAEQDQVNEMRLRNDREMAAAYRQYIEASEPEAAGSDQERLAQEVGNFTRAIGVG